MRLFVVILTLGVLSLACATPCGKGTSEGKCDADDGTGGADPEEVVITSVEGDATRGIIAWTVTSNGALGTAELWLVETGDPGYEGGCDASDLGSGGLVCGVWSERHDDFRTVSTDNADGGDTLVLELEPVDSFDQQEPNETTLFDLSTSWLSDELTVLVVVTDAAGDDVDCVTYGHEPAFFADECDNVW